MDILEKVTQCIKAFDANAFTQVDVLNILNKETLQPHDLMTLLSTAADKFLENMAIRAKQERARYHGNNVALYTPLYISNYCVNHCVYCGFNCNKDIRRGKLSLDEIERECHAVADMGLTEILLLTGESREHSPVEYIAKAVEIAATCFSTVGVEIYSLECAEYHALRRKGADFVSVYQETYDRDVYKQCHPDGPKSDYDYRFNSQERALQSGMRGVGFGALLGLDDWRRDALAAAVHAYYVQQVYPHIEISFSVPRLRGYGVETNERELLQVLLAYRIFMPYASINISTRERAHFRNHVLELAANKISAGVKVGVGGHGDEAKGDEQFAISDPRGVDEIHKMIVQQGLQPVYTDYIRV
ncbi:MAG: 2-iminoacetate synthase ThiH [Oscillospiraceae bacterium]|nr:2-iminoacetate synthase ThiH [Oscillospiraceae bacterium]